MFNAHCDKSMNGDCLQPLTEETALGIIVSNDLKTSKQCVSAVKKANMTLGLIKRHIVSRDINTIKPCETEKLVRILYTSMESVINQRYRFA